MGRSSRVDFSRGCKGRPGWVLDWFGWICHLCGVAGEVETEQDGDDDQGDEGGAVAEDQTTQASWSNMDENITNGVVMART